MCNSVYQLERDAVYILYVILHNQKDWMGRRAAKQTDSTRNRNNNNAEI